MGPRIRNDRFSDTPGSGAVIAGGEKSLPARRSAASRIIRSLRRSGVLAFSLAEVLLRFWLTRLHCGSALTLRQRALWLHDACALILRRLGMEVQTSGELPRRGLVVSNHLSYLDILFYAATMPCVFVAKSDVRSWPVFGVLAQCGGTIFVKRERSTAVAETARQIEDALREEIPVLLFPEGTSSDGSSVLPFYPSLLEPALQSGAEMTAAAVRYRIDGAEERDLCYYGDITFGPHLVKMLGMGRVRGELCFDSEAHTWPDRKMAARALREKVTAMRGNRIGLDA
jgi:1-acyl-sn-glycerol-3-phosphate acyltransferase